MNMYDGKSPNDFITFEMMGTEHEFPQQNVHVSLEHCLFYHHCIYSGYSLNIRSKYISLSTGKAGHNI